MASSRTLSISQSGIHRVENLPSFGQRALSLHFYSRPFASCTVYDVDKGVKGRWTWRLRYDTVPP